MEEQILKVGDLIEWSFPDDHMSKFAGKTYKSKISMVYENEECYGVYAEYGQDLIPFENARLVEPTP